MLLAAVAAMAAATAARFLLPLDAESEPMVRRLSALAVVAVFGVTYLGASAVLGTFALGDFKRSARARKD